MRPDRLTLVAIAAVAYMLANGVDEGVGHGGACLLMGGRPVALSAVFFECDKSGLPASAHRWIAAAGTLANLALGGLAMALLARSRRRDTPTLLRNQRRSPPSAEAALSIPRSRAWVAVGALTALVFIAVLGPSIRF